jgi:hypothetical protein
VAKGGAGDEKGTNGHSLELQAVPAKRKDLHMLVWTSSALPVFEHVAAVGARLGVDFDMQDSNVVLLLFVSLCRILNLKCCSSFRLVHGVLQKTLIRTKLTLSIQTLMCVD